MLHTYLGKLNSVEKRTLDPQIVWAKERVAVRGLWMVHYYYSAVWSAKIACAGNNATTSPTTNVEEAGNTYQFMNALLANFDWPLISTPSRSLGMTRERVFIMHTI